MDSSLFYLLIIGVVLNFLLIITVIFIVLKRTSGKNDNSAQIEVLDKVKREILDDTRATRQEMSLTIQSSFKGLSELLGDVQKQTSIVQDKRLSELNVQLTQKQDTLQKTVSELMQQIDKRFVSFSLQSEQKLDNIRTTVENRLTSLQDENGKKLEQMRATVDEKLQKTLEERIGQSFKLVSERLEQVYKGLGEMQTLAAGVGDLKKVLSNVKTRGIVGEIQLGAILEEMLSKNQYDTNVITKRGSSNFVEYAVKLPGEDGVPVYLPIDAKFPGDIYNQLIDAYDTGDQSKIDLAGLALQRTIKLCAKDIKDKYIDPPHTTDFAIMFLPFEGLYAEVIRRGLIETLQNEYKISIAGPTTMAALLNSLQMGFRTLAIQERSVEVWNVLGAVKTEFDKFADVLAATQQKIELASTELDKLVGVRTRQIQRRLRGVTALSETSGVAVLTASENDEEVEILS